jgi:RNase P/RNase MRP subunit p29
MGHGRMVAQRAGENLRDDLLRAIDGGGGSEGVPANRDGPLWEELQIEPKVRKRLEYEQVAPKTVKELAERGMSAEELAEFVQSFQREYPHSGVADGSQLAKMLNDLGKYGRRLREAKELLQATAERGQKAFKEVERTLKMMNELEASGRLNNPQGLRNALEDATPELIEKGRSGHLRELEIALERVRQGHDVQLGAMYDYRLGRDVGGDVVDFTAKEVIQSKDLTAKSEATLWENIETAALQAMGKRGEFPPIDSRGTEFKKVIEIRIDPIESGQLAKINGRILLKKLEERVQLHGEMQDFDGLIRIRVGERIMEFRIRSGNPSTVQRLSW